ncbi:16S rRNA processing protein RimM [Parabacteroides sp. PF5-5]|uniref:ribosome maturation factor RimM n=1 Tax=unclassified Parabacteroides TaxID=2649774 RepID=UPI00247409D5|nr:MULTISPECIES: ribosome maturation factor RimM [unclassified Parabacteroides]MDH6306933.1 16S rRNA processing protein RimM [Parabacteroides sp. PH5-39]MDH6317806.1 16S rRNA processing protein RimM [Parabacteroides sp. PF5-13]MDH6321538.1 16S rRNA processing protein RimM [Parabacteroides sp. PH5-13]MDH6325320.1 16S rRNA processing protein RimM [Parabacteroides sp. PH5-8]MDH6328991.1 16S rRNA processing protein RimM [Parabacteroides sp. PH5-41]
MIRKEDVCKIGYFAKPHGIKGEINLVSSSNAFDETDEPYIICDMDGILVPFYVEEYRYKSENVILVKMENVDSEESARHFTNREVFYPLADMPEKDTVDGISWDSFIGYQVIDEKLGTLGEITDVDESTINILLQVHYQGRELLIPAADELILSADHVNKSISVSIPEGLLDI